MYFLHGLSQGLSTLHIFQGMIKIWLLKTTKDFVCVVCARIDLSHCPVVVTSIVLWANSSLPSYRILPSVPRAHLWVASDPSLQPESLFKEASLLIFFLYCIHYILLNLKRKDLYFVSFNLFIQGRWNTQVFAVYLEVKQRIKEMSCFQDV